MWFTYPHTGIQAVRNFNLSIKTGEKIAIIGRTGSGKTTLAQLLLRMYDVTDGENQYGWMDNIQELDLNTLREQISYVPQDVFLFSETVSNNIGFGLDKQVLNQVKEAASRPVWIRKLKGFRTSMIP